MSSQTTVSETQARLRYRIVIENAADNHLAGLQDLRECVATGVAPISREELILDWMENGRHQNVTPMVRTIVAARGILAISCQGVLDSCFVGEKVIMKLASIAVGSNRREGWR